MTYDRKDIPAIADEYVLGLIEATDAAELEVVMESDAELRAAIAASRERFLPLDMSVAPATVTEQLWQRIEAALPLQDHTGVMPLISNANDNRRNGWRMAAISAVAAAFLLAIGLAYSLTRTVEPLVVAVLINDAGEVQAVVEDFGNAQATIRILADFSIPGDKTIQVWTLPSKDTGPVSLGLIDGARSAHLAVPELPTPRGGQLYEITLEDAGGSPTGRPTGPILAKGLAKLLR